MKNPLAAEWTSLLRNIVELRDHIVAECDSLATSYGASSSDNPALDLVQIASQLLALAPTYDETQARLQKQSDTAEQATAVYDTFVMARKEAIGKAFQSIQEEINRLYQFIRPGEAAPDLRLEMSATRTTPLSTGGAFAHLSESRLC